VRTVTVAIPPAAAVTLRFDPTFAAASTKEYEEGGKNERRTNDPIQIAM
jgi:hypothetical protein